jgi:hypothetical protein
MTMPRRDLKDKKYHHLTMLRPSRSGGAGVGMFWLAQCDCGTIKEIRGSDVAAGRIKTCGKCEYHSAVLETRVTKETKKEAGVRIQLRRYITSALKRKISWLLTPEQFLEIIAQDCTYCGAPPRNYRSQAKNRRRGNITTSMNGVDRVSSTEGYTLANTVPCCSICNRMKMAMDADIFINQCRKITERMAEAKKALDENGE